MPAILARPRTALSVWSCLVLTACRGQAPAQTAAQQAPGGPPTIEVVKVVEQPLDVTLSLPGELNPQQSVALFARVSGFVKTIRVDRGSQVRTGESIAVLEAPELVAQRFEAQSKLQGAEAQLGSVRSKAEADASTYDQLRAAAATPGVVAGNDLVGGAEGGRSGSGTDRGGSTDRRGGATGAQLDSRRRRVPADYGTLLRRRDRAERAPWRPGGTRHGDAHRSSR